jgi:hypothetical protein
LSIKNTTHQLLAYADDVNILGGIVHTVRENAEALVVATNEIGLEVNTDKTKYMVWKGNILKSFLSNFFVDFLSTSREVFRTRILNQATVTPPHLVYNLLQLVFLEFRFMQPQKLKARPLLAKIPIKQM